MYNDENIDTTESEGSSGYRGAKGSIRDRLISIIFRKRYEKFKLQKEFYTKDNIERKIKYIRTLKDLEIDNLDKLDNEDKTTVRKLEFYIPILPLNKKNKNINVPDTDNVEELHKISDNIINEDSTYDINGRIIFVDSEKEEFDFDNYDYYELEEIKHGMSIKNHDDDVIEIEKEEKKAVDEKVIVEEIQKFTSDSLIILDEIKEEIKVIKDEVSKPYTLEEARKIEQRYVELKNKINKLKCKFDTVKYKYDFADFAILDSIKIMDAIEDYQDNAKLDEIETMVNVCKNEIEKIDGIVIENEKSIKVGYELEEKKEKIKTRTISFNKNKENTNKVSCMEDKVAKELIEQRKILEDIKSRVDVIEITQIPKVNISGYGRMFASFLRVAAGILTTPVSNSRIFGIALGTNLINKGIRGLRQGLTVEQTVELSYKYEDLEREIINCKDKLSLTNLLLIDSIEQIDKLRDEFKDKFEAYIYVIPEYNESLKKIDLLKKQLENKKLEIDIINKDLDLQYKKNKIKMKKVKK